MKAEFVTCLVDKQINIITKEYDVQVDFITKCHIKDYIESLTGLFNVIEDKIDDFLIDLHEYTNGEYIAQTENILRDFNSKEYYRACAYIARIRMYEEE